MLKNVLIYSVTIVYTISIGVLSLAHLTKVPELNTGFDDKIAHFVLYAGLCLFWFMSFHILKSKSSLLLASLFSIVFGAVIEILQGVVSIYRTADVFDLVANCLGILTMALIIHTKKEVIIKKL
ncbi:MAG: VanZ family protein [Flavobacteriaceae bacterium]|nr:VanZ family protein [Flavobacteriaceae bacterium]MDA7728291.1 VanZ family protein [Flavobacteriaceae bacterium]MDG1309402.1 VanZ family protein [Flavobacteriaceae bacterium]